MNQLMVNSHYVQRYAFFDVDETLISVKSMLSFQEFWFEHVSDVDRKAFEKDLRELHSADASWTELNIRYYQYFAGRKVAQVKDMGERWFRQQLAQLGFYHYSVLKALQRHQSLGDDIVFVSGSFPAVLRPIARHLGVRHILSSSLEISGDSYTGRLIGSPAIGQGKALLIQQFLDVMGVDATDCFAYGDDISDLPMLELVGNPRVVSGGRYLEDHARERGWQVINALAI
jgi:HAD superfamily hydrolase (TIGR01490 family)